LTNKKNNAKLADMLMENLLNKTPEIKPPLLGDLVVGKVIDISSNSVYIDLGARGTGIIFGIELRDGMKTYENLKAGDEISATVVEPENENGYIELSLREASLEKAWKTLEENLDKAESMIAKVIDANKGGLIIELNNITGFLPVSQLSPDNYPRVEAGNRNQILSHLRGFIGKDLKIQIIGLDQEKEKLIVSEKALRQEEFDKIIANLKIGQAVEGVVTGIAQFGVFVKFKIASREMEGLVHISELAWQRIEDPAEIVKVNDQVKAKIISLDNNRVALSIKDLKKDPWIKISKKYQTGDIIKGKVIKIDNFGAFVELDKDIHGLAHISQFKAGEIDKKLKLGKKYNFKISSIEAKEHRMGLELCPAKAKTKKSRSPAENQS